MVWFEALHNCAYTNEISLLDSYLGEVAKKSGCSPKPPTTSRSGNAECSANVGTCSDASLLSGSCSLPDPTVFPDKLFTEDDSSDLTHGNVCFFNPVLSHTSNSFWMLLLMRARVLWIPPTHATANQVQHVLCSTRLTYSSVGFPLFLPAAEDVYHLGCPPLSPLLPCTMCCCVFSQPHAAMLFHCWCCLSDLITAVLLESHQATACSAMGICARSLRKVWWCDAHSLPTGSCAQTLCTAVSYCSSIAAVNEHCGLGFYRLVPLAGGVSSLTSHPDLQASPKHRSTTALLALVTWKYHPTFPDSWKHLYGVTLPVHRLQIR